MISTVIIGAVISLLGVLYMMYHISQDPINFTASIAGLVVLICGCILLYGAFRPVIM